MSEDNGLFGDLYAGLQALADSTFPKKCSSCGRAYETAEEFVAQTEAIQQKSGLKQSIDDDDRPIVELYRNCVCGSTLMDFFDDRRDASESGLKRRKKFGELMDYLIERDIEAGTARAELLKVVRGQESEILKDLTPPQKQSQ